MRFVHLHNHFWGSYSDSVLSLDEGLERASALGQEAMAITDHGELAFAPLFYCECRQRGMKPLLGCECYFVDNAKDRIERRDGSRNHLILIAKNERGYRNLVSLTSRAWLDNCFGGARGLVDWALLEKYHEGLVCLSGCYYGSFPLKIIRESREAGEAELRRYLDLFGDDFHPEMSRLGFEEQEVANAAIMELAPRYGLKPVVTNDVHYPYPGDWLAHDIIAKSRFGKVSDFSVVTRAIWLKSLEEMKVLGFPDECLRNTAGVADKCEVALRGSVSSPPLFRGAHDEDADELARRCLEAIGEKVAAGKRAGWRDRIGREIHLIGEARLAGYILAAAELARYFRRARTSVRALGGRGAGSAIAYLLGFSDGIPEPDDVPAIDNFNDLALCCPNRGSAIAHLIDVMGEERVCRVADLVPITGGDALGFTAEVIGIPPGERERALENVVGKGSVDENLCASAPLRSLCGAYPDLARLARRIEGIPRVSRPSESSVILTAGPLRDLVPLKPSGKTIFSQYDAANARAAGFLTMELTDEEKSKGG